jgi:hypothetical protein
MARKEIDIVITEEGRDKDKAFHIREMPAYQTERWAIRAILALGRAGVEVPEDIRASGMAGIAYMGMQALMKLQYGDAEPLLDEMMACVTIKPDPARPEITRQLWPDDIEEVATLLKLRSEVFKLHTDF